jgi:hypothetical protein
MYGLGKNNANGADRAGSVWTVGYLEPDQMKNCLTKINADSV